MPRRSSASNAAGATAGVCMLDSDSSSESSRLFLLSRSGPSRAATRQDMPRVLARSRGLQSALGWVSRHSTLALSVSFAAAVFRRKSPRVDECGARAGQGVVPTQTRSAVTDEGCVPFLSFSIATNCFYLAPCTPAALPSHAPISSMLAKTMSA